MDPMTDEDFEEWQRQEHGALQEAVAHAYDWARKTATPHAQLMAAGWSLYERVIRGLVDFQGDELP